MSLYKNIRINREDCSDSEVTSVLQKVGLGYLVDRIGLHNAEVNLDESLSGGEKLESVWHDYYLENTNYCF